jgi:hypothetical protein
MTNYLPHEYGLLVARQPCRLKQVKGEVRAFDSTVTIFESPLVITDSDDYSLEGIASGHRSALIIADGVVYKIKGCAIEKAFISDEVYRRTHATEAPLGGEILIDAENELLRTKQIGDLITQGGFHFPYDPQELFDYKKQWTPEDVMSPWFRKVYDIIKEHSYFKTLLDLPSPVGLGASVTRIRGDTRLPEIYLLRELSQVAVSDISYKFGLSAGAQMRLTENFYWGRGDAHLGNFVVFHEKDQIHIAMTDFEETRPRLGLGRYDRLHHSLNNVRLPFSVWWAGYNFRKKGESKVPSANFRKGFKRGFKEGWKNPNKRDTINFELLKDAYALH